MKKSFEEIISGYDKVNMLTALREMDGVLQGKCIRRMVECLCDNHYQYRPLQKREDN